jgi:CRISPR system Cascade subunit CasB
MIDKDKAEGFITYIIARMYSGGIQDRGVCAVLKRADNPSTEYQAWEYLAPFVRLEDPERQAFALIASAIAKNELTQDGHCGIGRAIARCYDEGRDSEQAKNKLRRLLACSDRDELYRILRPILSLIRTKCSDTLHYGGLLRDLITFSPAKTLARWASDFYHTVNDGEEGGC